jgi:hypothetical protein
MAFLSSFVSEVLSKALAQIGQHEHEVEHASAGRPWSARGVHADSGDAA